ncbi:GerAB/ArcD/ProY family transporter [Paenibacillus sp.]|jgi:spore germination protein (amino acid permease)|uniref:GerAB/ArcD/ProY family transporter n=1 Tax=Paenibacillus sp. TaxID=58172 RepID=UPI0028172704|nr:GerAB/ArcD/ProY family transporter [Paenibacillus sp.]MDR0268129.1 spore germination protein [Paenibacillus sp.]
MLAEKKMSLRQLFLFIIQAQIGVGVLSIPSKLTESAKGGAGITVIITGVITQLIILMFWVLLHKLPGLNLFQICLRLGGPFIGRLLIICYIAYFTLLGANVTLSAIGILQHWMMESTPRWVLLGLFSLMTLYLAREKLTVLARFFTLSSGLFIPLIILVGYGLTQAHFEYMFPIMEAGIGNILRGTKDTTISMYGFEVILVIFPLIDGSDKKKLFVVSMSNLFVTLFYTFVVVTCLMVFSQEQLRVIPEPVIYLVKSLNFYVVDRADVLFLPIWTITIVCSISSYIYSASMGLTQLFKQKDHKNFALYVKIVMYCIALLPVTPIAIHHLDTLAEYAAYLFIAIIPFTMMIGSMFIRRKEGGTV